MQGKGTVVGTRCRKVPKAGIGTNRHHSAPFGTIRHPRGRTISLVGAHQAIENDEYESVLVQGEASEREEARKASSKGKKQPFS